MKKSVFLLLLCLLLLPQGSYAADAPAPYGANLFQGNFGQGGAAGAIAPGDRVVLRLWGGSLNVDTILEVSPAGQLDIPEVGQLNVTGLAQDKLQDALRSKLASMNEAEAKHLDAVADYLIKKSVWILGGDGWAYDIGFGGLDHAIASGKNINILVMDTGVYSNTGGQQSKATPMGASAKFATAGKALPKKDLGMIAMSYGNVYVAQISVGANDMQTIKALNEAEAYDGPSLIIAYSHCIAQGFNLADGLQHQKNAVETGSWPLFRYNPENIKEGKAPLMLDSKAPSRPLSDYMANETRFQIVNKMNPERYETLLNKAQENVKEKRSLLEHMAEYKVEEEADSSAAE